MPKQLILCIGVVCTLAAAVHSVRGDAFNSPTDVRLATIRSLIDAGDSAAAEQMAAEVTQAQPGLVDGWMLLGYARTLNGHFAESNEAYERALEQGAVRKEVFTLKAYNCRRLGDPAKTRECYRAILETDAANIDILMQYGAYESMVESYDSATEIFGEVLNLQPEHYEAIDAMAKIEEKRGNKAQVKFWLEKGLSFYPQDTKFLKRISLVYLNEQNYTMTVMYLDRLLEVDPTSDAGYRNLGIAQYQQGNKREAAGAFARVHELNGKMDGLYGPLADCYRSIGRKEDALTIIREGIAAGSQSAWLYSVWGKILEDQGQYDVAVAKFSEAVTLRDEPWSGYAKKQIARQGQLKKRAEMIAAQGAMQ